MQSLSAKCIHIVAIGCHGSSIYWIVIIGRSMNTVKNTLISKKTKSTIVITILLLSQSSNK